MKITAKQLNRYRMKRILLFFLLLGGCLSACKKSVNVKAQIAAQLTKDKQLISTYLKNNNISANVVDSAGIATGVYYTVDTLGTGSNLFTNSTQITVGYTAWWLKPDETLSPAIVSTSQFHPSFVLGGVIRGWQLGIPQINGGGVITLYVPSHYAYGPYPQPNLGLPANAVLVFHITLYNISN